MTKAWAPPFEKPPKTVVASEPPSCVARLTYVCFRRHDELDVAEPRVRRPVLHGALDKGVREFIQPPDAVSKYDASTRVFRAEAQGSKITHFSVMV